MVHILILIILNHIHPDRHLRLTQGLQNERETRAKINATITNDVLIEFELDLFGKSL